MDLCCGTSLLGARRRSGRKGGRDGGKEGGNGGHKGRKIRGNRRKIEIAGRIFGNN
jgi:hypothetical protein